MPKISVVMPTFNDEETVESSVQSISEQTFQDWELLIVDDASTDQTFRIVTDIAAQDDRISVTLQEENGGSGAARNRAISLAKGEFVAIMDADDLSIESRLERQLAAFRLDETLAAVASQVGEFGKWGGPLEARWPTADEDVRKRQLGRKMPLPHPSCMFRTSVLREVGGYDETCRRAQDYALFLKLESHRIRCLPQVHVLYRTSRPVDLAYVQRNARYAALALKRHELFEQGVPRSELPTEPSMNALTELSALKSWIVRSLRERVFRP